MLVTAISDQEIAALARELIAIDSANPPGDVNEVAKLVESYLGDNCIPYRLYRETSDRVNIVATVAGTKSVGGKHVVWSGHLDTFPMSANQLSPHQGATDYVYGRGAADMKGGVAGFLVALKHFNENQAHFGGKITLVLVCDEETFGPHGMNALRGVRELFEADCVLTSEPSGRGVIRYGERGPVWGRAIFESAEGHAAYAEKSENAIERASAFVRDISESFDQEIASPLRLQDSALLTPRSGGDEISLNIGRIEGGIKVNMQPTKCTVEVDVRVPQGVSTKSVTDWLKAKSNKYDGRYEADVVVEGNKSDPQHRLFELMSEAITELSGLDARLEVASGSTDARHWREFEIPAVQYGAEPRQQATSGERVSVAELGEIARVHALTTLKFLNID